MKWAISTIARRDEDNVIVMYHTMGIVEAETETEANGLALACCIKVYPPLEGFKEHQTKAIDIRCEPITIDRVGLLNVVKSTP